MGSLNNRRLYAAALGITAVGFVLDRTVFSDSGLGPESAKAELAGPSHAPASTAAKAEPVPDRTAVLALVEKLRTFERSQPAGPPSRLDAFALANLGPDTDTPTALAADNPADDGPVAAFRKAHILRTVLAAGDSSLVVVDSSRLSIGDKLDGFRLESIRREKGKPGSATFVRGDLRVELIVPTGSGRPKSADSNPTDSPPGS